MSWRFVFIGFGCFVFILSVTLVVVGAPQDR